MKIALLVYPLSSEYQRSFEEVVGEISEYLLLPELRRLSLFKMIAKFHSPNLECLYLPLEDVNSSALLPMLEVVSLFSNAKTIALFTPDLGIKPVTRFQAIFSLLKLITASVSGWFSLKKAELEVNSLLKTPLQEVKISLVQRILYLKTNLWYGVKIGGSVGHVAGVVNGFCRKGYTIDFIGSEPPIMVDPKVKFYKIKPLSAYSLPWETNLYRFSNILIGQVREMALTKPSFIYQRLSVGDYSGPILARKFGVPLILEYNGSEAWVAKNWGTPLRFHNLAVKAEEVCLRHANLIVVISEVLRDELVGKGIPKTKIITYPNCIDPLVFNPDHFGPSNRVLTLKRYGISEDAVVATFIGTFGEWHGVDILAAAIRQMVEEYEDWLKVHKLRFLLIGDGLKMSMVRDILAIEKIQLYCTLTGLIPQNQAPAYLAASDILLSPHVPNSDGSRFFGSPTKIFEYMAMGKGIVASDLEQIGQVLKNSLRVGVLPSRSPTDSDQELAVLCKAGDKNELIAGIRFLTEKIAWRDHLGRNSRREVLRKYTWDQHVSEILARVK